MGKAKLNGQAKHRSNTGNLRPPWKPGECPNPAGRPTKDACIRQWVRELASEIPDGESMPWAQLVALAMYRKASRGDTHAARLILDRIEPAVTVTADLTPALSRDEVISEIAANSRDALSRWAAADGLILEN